MAFYRAAIGGGGGSISPTIQWAGVITRNGSHSETISTSKSYILTMSVNYNTTYNPNSQKIYKLVNGTLTLMQTNSGFSGFNASLSGTTLTVSSTANAGISCTLIKLD